MLREITSLHRTVSETDRRSQIGDVMTVDLSPSSPYFWCSPLVGEREQYNSRKFREKYYLSSHNVNIIRFIEQHEYKYISSPKQTCIGKIDWIIF